MIPNTFIIGSMKSATTGLCDILNHHPDVFVSCPKEPDFFSRDEIYAKGLRWYESLFRGVSKETVVAEGSTSYTKHLQYPQAARRLAEHAPDAKLIFMARNPLQRIQSHWGHEVLKGRTSLEFESFVRSHPETIDISLYWKQINHYRELFPDERIFVLFFEDYRNSTQQVVDQCCQFLGIDSCNIDDLKIDRNETSKRRQDVAAIRLLRQSRWFDMGLERTKKRIPNAIYQPMKRLLKSRSGAGDAKWSPDLLRWVGDQINSDSQRFLDFYDKPSDFWSDFLPKTVAANSSEIETHN
tara:strand:- start:6586 stop:7476 length:891 start_codon:yes stop_codon:yes gene_type:complete